MSGWNPYRRRKQKFNAKSCRCLSDHRHDSRDEANYCNCLFAKKQQGLILDFHRCEEFSLDVNGYHICCIQPDFKVLTLSGVWEIHEYKGFETREWQIKSNLFKALYPQYAYIVKRQKDLW